MVPTFYQKTNLTTEIHTLQKQIGTEWTKGMNIMEHLDNIKMHQPKLAKEKAPEDDKGKKKRKGKKH